MGWFDSIKESVGSMFGAEKPPEAAHPFSQPAPGPGSTPAGPAPAEPGKKPPPDSKMVENASANLDRAMKGWGTDEAAIHNVLRGKSAEEIAAIKAEYAKKHPGSSLDAALKDELSGDDLKEAQAYLAGDPVKAAATALKAASSGIGTDEAKLMATLKGLTPEQSAQVRAQFKKDTGQSVDAMLDDELSGAELKEAKAELSTKFSAGLGPEIDELAKKSPTLVGRLSSLADDGWTISYGTAGKGTFADPNKKEIVIDPNKKGDTLGIVRSLAHEGGHGAYTGKKYVQPKGKTKDQYVDANVMENLKDEGEATISNLEVRKELLDAKAGDIGVSGAKGDEYKKLYEKYPDAKDRDKLREEIGKVYAKGEVPSVKKDDGTPYTNYEEYYAKTYKDHWDKHVTPDKDGKAPEPTTSDEDLDDDDHSKHGH